MSRLIAMIGQKGPLVSADGGGIERHAEELGARLAVLGDRVVMYVRPRHQRESERSYRGMTLVRAVAIETKSLDALTHAFFATIDALRRRADVFHYHGIGPATLAWLPRILAPRAIVVVTFHSIDRLHGKWGPIARAYLRYAEWAACVFPHVTIAVSRAIAAYCRKTYGREALHIPNGAAVPPYPGDELLGGMGLVPGRYVLTVARLVRQKGIHHLLAAFDGFEPEVSLAIVGAPSFGEGYADELRRTAAGNSAIRFLGFRTGEELAQLYANCYAYVHPSDAEGLPIAVLEAMSHGRAVLVSDIPEHLESIDGSGLTFVKADPDDLRAQLRRLLNHPEIAADLGARARERVRQEYDWEDIARRVARAYDRPASH